MNTKNILLVGSIFVALFFAVSGPFSVAVFLVEARGGWAPALFEARFVLWMQLLIAVLVMITPDGRNKRRMMLTLIPCGGLALATAVGFMIFRQPAAYIVCAGTIAFGIIGGIAFSNTAWLVMSHDKAPAHVPAKAAPPIHSDGREKWN